MLKLKLLLVEDNPADVRLVQTYLSNPLSPLKSELDVVSTLAGALTAVKHRSFDAILLDLRLPDGSDELCFRRLQEQTDVPIIVLSGTDDELLAKRLVKLGAQECFPKNHLDEFLLRRLIWHAIERKELLDRVLLLTRSMERLDKLQSIGEIASGLAHELRHPLTTLTLALDFLRDCFDSGDVEATRRLQGMQSSLTRAQRVITGLLDFASDGETYFAPQPIHLSTIIRETLDLMSIDLKDQRIQLELHLTDPLPELHLDRSRIEQVLINLLRNAIQATHGTPKPTICVATKSTLGGICLTIADNGCGLSEDDLPKVFTPFYSSKKRGDGTGLGLTVSKELVELHGGTLELLQPPPPENGCLARVFLPFSIPFRRCLCSETL